MSEALISFWFDIQLFAGIKRAAVNLSVKLCPDVFQPAVISERSPLSVDTHPALISFHQVNVTQLLHVAGIGTST